MWCAFYTSEILKFHENCCFFKPIFCENFEIAAVQKDANLVELEKCCRTHIFLQNFVLVQPRTSPPKICKILLIFPILLTASTLARPEVHRLSYPFDTIYDGTATNADVFDAAQRSVDGLLDGSAGPAL